ncbi:MAG TPA: glycosyltransferase family 4 protein [Mucilaginibacter sp.]|jgi:glycosyltransferase involved in cell wall biosynthesis|nr:glycosyltransferase family 4 protein [Mucilaginibacter sp.]
MKFVFASYVYSKDFNRPEGWLHHIRFYGGVLESLSKNNTVISIEQIDFEGQLIYKGVQYYFKRFSKLARRFPFKLHYFIKKRQPDVVFIQGLHYPLQVIQLRLTLRKKVKIIVQNHAEKPFTGIKKYLQKIADRCIDAYLFASRDMGLDWVKKGNLATSEKIHEVMEVSSVFYPLERETARAHTAVEGQPVFLWVGRLNKNKDPLNVIKAFLQFVDSEPSARLYMIYQTVELLPQIKAFLEKSPNKSAVKLIGQIPNDNLLYWYNSADYILSGSHYEGSGTAVCEAMSCGCIPIVTDIAAFRAITDNGECGLLYEPGNQHALLSALVKSQTMDTSERRIKTLAWFNQNLSFDAIARKIQAIADSL